jgi:hypothetical protein
VQSAGRRAKAANFRDRTAEHLAERSGRSVLRDKGRPWALVDTQSVGFERLGMLSRALLRRLRKRDGQAIVELAVVLPVILILILAVVDIGKAYGYQNDETHLANEAARYAAVAYCGDTCPAIDTAVRNDAPNELKNGTGSIVGPVSVTLCFPGTPADRNPVKATVTATYRWLPYLASKLGMPTTVTISASATARMEKDPIANPIPNSVPVGPC